MERDRCHEFLFDSVPNHRGPKKKLKSRSERSLVYRKNGDDIILTMEFLKDNGSVLPEDIITHDHSSHFSSFFLGGLMEGVDKLDEMKDMLGYGDGDDADSVEEVADNGPKGTVASRLRDEDDDQNATSPRRRKTKELTLPPDNRILEFPKYRNAVQDAIKEYEIKLDETIDISDERYPLWFTKQLRTLHLPIGRKRDTLHPPAPGSNMSHEEFREFYDRAQSLEGKINKFLIGDESTKSERKLMKTTMHDLTNYTKFMYRASHPEYLGYIAENGIVMGEKPLPINGADELPYGDVSGLDSMAAFH